MIQLGKAKVRRVHFGGRRGGELIPARAGRPIERRWKERDDLSEIEWREKETQFEIRGEREEERRASELKFRLKRRRKAGASVCRG